MGNERDEILKKTKEGFQAHKKKVSATRGGVLHNETNRTTAFRGIGGQ